MPETTVEAYGRYLFDRRAEARYIPALPSADLPRLVRADGSRWEPAPHDCHVNVSTMCAAIPEWRPVRGWLLFDFIDLLRFTAHSVIALPDGQLCDITPSNTSRPYPFLAAGIGEPEYCELIDHWRVQHLDYELATDRVYAQLG